MHGVERKLRIMASLGYCGPEPRVGIREKLPYLGIVFAGCTLITEVVVAAMLPDPYAFSVSRSFGTFLVAAFMWAYWYQLVEEEIEMTNVFRRRMALEAYDLLDRDDAWYLSAHLDDEDPSVVARRTELTRTIAGKHLEKLARHGFP